MLRWIFVLSVSCFVSALVALGYVVPITHSMQNLLLTLTALTAALLVPSFDAFETEARADADEDA